MPETRAEKAAYIANWKKVLVEADGCDICGKGEVGGGFERYWYDPESGRADGIVEEYEPRRFVFKYTERRDSDIPAAQLSRYKKSTLNSINEALTRCVILCRSCADPRRTRKEVTQCQLSPPTTVLPKPS